MTIPIIKIKVLPKPVVKGKMDVRFPANIGTDEFISVEKANGTYTFGVDYSVLTPGPIADPTTAYIAIEDQTAGIYKTVTLASLLTSGLDADLQAIAALTGTGILARTADGTWALRSITGTANEISVANGNGVSGAPTISLPAALTFTGKVVTGGTLNGPTIEATDSTLTIHDDVDGTKQGRFQLSGVATATTRTLTWPNADTTIVGTDVAQTLTNKTIAGTNNSLSVRIANDVSGLGTGVATFLATPSSANLRAALTDESGTGVAYFQGGDLGTPSAGVLTSATGLPISSGVSGLGTGVATFLATPSSANLRAALTDEVGTGAAYFVGGALGTPASATLTNATGLPASGLTAQAAYTILGNATGSSASPTAISIPALTQKVSPTSTDKVMIADAAASDALKYVTISALASAGSVASLNTKTGALTLSVVAQVFTASGTYTPTSGMVYAQIECWGGGGGGAGVASAAAGSGVGSGGGGAGSYSLKVSTAAAVGASQTVTIGAAGGGGASGANPGSAGGDTSVGTLCVGKGGAGGAVGTASIGGAGGNGGVAGTGDVTTTGQPGGTGLSAGGSLSGGLSGFGGSSSVGGGGQGITSLTASGGNPGTGKGSGGGGAQSFNAGGAGGGGSGAAGYVMITEFVIA